MGLGADGRKDVAALRTERPTQGQDKISVMSCRINAVAKNSVLRPIHPIRPHTAMTPSAKKTQSGTGSLQMADLGMLLTCVLDCHA